MVLDSELHRLLNMNMLKGESTYRALPHDPTIMFQGKFKSLLQQGVELVALTQSESEKLYIDHRDTGFHLLPKLHKGVFHPPLRPIVAGIGSMRKKLIAWVDSYLQPYVGISSTYIRDTEHVESLLDGQTWQDGYQWLFCYVTVLYPSIPQDQAVCVVAQYPILLVHIVQKLKPSLY